MTLTILNPKKDLARCWMKERKKYSPSSHISLWATKKYLDLTIDKETKQNKNHKQRQKKKHTQHTRNTIRPKSEDS